MPISRQLFEPRRPRGFTASAGAGRSREHGSVPGSRPPSWRSAAGFTLIEVLVAVLILAVGLLGLAGLQLTSMKTNDSAERRMRATVAVQDVLERMRMTPTDFTGDHASQVVGSGAEVSDEFGQWESYVDLLGLPALPTGAPVERGWVNCGSGNPCGAGNCQVGVGWDDRGGDRVARELGDADTRKLEHMTVSVCSRIAEAI